MMEYSVQDVKGALEEIVFKAESFNQAVECWKQHYDLVGETRTDRYGYVWVWSEKDHDWQIAAFVRPAYDADADMYA
jgi:hypothetical protein